MKRIYSILVENHAGVLCKTAGLFWRRCFNIDSITVGAGAVVTRSFLEPGIHIAGVPARQIGEADAPAPSAEGAP